MADVSIERPLTALEQELAARVALLAAEMYKRHDWEFGGWTDDRYVPGAESLARTISHLIAMGGGETGRFMVTNTDLGLEVYLNLGALYEDIVSVDDGLALASTGRPIPSQTNNTKEQ